MWSLILCLWVCIVLTSAHQTSNRGRAEQHIQVRNPVCVCLIPVFPGCNHLKSVEVNLYIIHVAGFCDQLVYLGSCVGERNAPHHCIPYFINHLLHPRLPLGQLFRNCCCHVEISVRCWITSSMLVRCGLSERERESDRFS